MSNKKTNGSNVQMSTTTSAKLSGLLTAVYDLVRKYVVVSDTQAIVIAVWVMHTYLLEAADRTPYLHISSPEKRSGKTLLLDVLKLVVRNPWFTSSATTAALARRFSAYPLPTALIDEADTLLGGNSERDDLIRGILDAGYARDGAFSRCTNSGVVKNFKVFCPKAIAGLQELPDTIADRSIPIRMKRALPGERRCRFRRHDVEPVAAELRKQIEAICTDALISQLKDARPHLIELLNDRQNDIVEPLLAIADFADGEWPARLRCVLVELFAGEAEEYREPGTQLLADIRDIFDELPYDKIETKLFLEKLYELQESPWAAFDHGRPLTANRLGRMLRSYRIRSRVWWERDRAVRGYRRCDFEDDWARHLPQRREAPEGQVAANVNGRDVDGDDEPAEPVFYGDGHGGASTSPPAVNSALAKPDSQAVHASDCFCPACRGGA